MCLISLDRHPEGRERARAVFSGQVALRDLLFFTLLKSIGTPSVQKSHPSVICLIYLDRHPEGRERARAVFSGQVALRDLLFSFCRNRSELHPSEVLLDTSLKQDLSTRDSLIRQVCLSFPCASP
jgi:hypothetical protein